MKMIKVIIFSLVLGFLLTATSLVYSKYVLFPDLEQTIYGFPLLWLFHQTNSIAGPVDKWYVQWSSLIIDFIFWLIISYIIIFVWNKYKLKKMI